MSVDAALTFGQFDRISHLKPAQWDALAATDNPFLGWRFLNNLETHVDLESHGWMPCHTVALRNGTPVAAIPLYSKTNSHGEFVFDYMIADAYYQAGHHYYPKLVSAIPFTPVMGPRILHAPDLENAGIISRQLVQYLCDHCTQEEISSLHMLFCNEATANILATQPFLSRSTWQYHWTNRGYDDFDGFLQQLTARRRKQIRRERQSIERQNIDVEILEGSEISEEQWAVFYDFYCSTFERKWGEPRFTLPFFQALSHDIPHAITLFLARHEGRYVAGSFTMKSAEILYGRHWGCNGWFPNLHFELCYYQTIDYCIQNRLRCLDAGVQGEHKLLRGFLPVRATSMHWFRHPEFMRAVDDFFSRESGHVNAQITALTRHTAYNSRMESGT